MAFNSAAPPTMEVIQDELEEVETENLGFLALKGDSRLRLFKESYTDDTLPPPSASLFTVANRLGLFVAAGPSTLICGTTASLRSAFRDAESDLVDYNPSYSIQLPAKVTHVVFDAAEKHLVVGTQSGDIAVYSTSDLSNISPGNEPAPIFEVAAGAELREVKPNPAVESSRYMAVVTSNGQVRVLDLEERNFGGGQGNVLKDNVTTVCWSQRGKAIVCGLGDGSGWQMKPDGLHMRTLPAVPDLENVFVSSITWIDNNLFSIMYSTVPSSPSEPTTESTFYLYTSPPAQCSFQKMPDPTPPFGKQRQSYHQGIRLFSWKPELQDLIIYTNTCSTDVGLLIRMESDRAEPEVPAHEFRVTTIANDARRAQLPMSESMEDTTAVGVALDLSSTENVSMPIAGSDIESTGPQPILYVLNNEGVLAGWHVIYSDAVRQGIPYPLLAMQSSQSEAVPQTPQTAVVPAAGPFATANRPAPAFGSPAALGSASAFGTGNAFSTPKPAFGQTTAFGGAQTPAPAFGTPSALAKPAFGTPSALGAHAKPAFGQPTFGTPSAFGSSTSAPAFGQTSAFGTPTQAAKPATETSSSGSAFGSGGSFGRFAQGGGFGAVSSKNDSGSVWGSGSAFKSAEKNEDSFSGLTGSSSGAFGSSNAQLKLPSLFQAAKPEKEDGWPQGREEGGGFLGGFGSAIGGALAAEPVAKDTDMDEKPSTPSGAPALDSAYAAKPSPFQQPQTSSPFGTGKPTSAFGQTAAFGSPSSMKSPFSGSTNKAQSAFGAPQPAFGSPSQSVFGSGAGQSAFGKPTPAFGSPSTSAFGKPAFGQVSQPAFGQTAFGQAPKSVFGQPSPGTKEPALIAPKPLPAPKETALLKDRAESPATPQRSPEPAPEEAPLPPDPTPSSKISSSKVSAAPESAPLPPDPVPSKKSSIFDAPPLPPDSSTRTIYGPGDSSAEASAASSKAEASPPETPDKADAQKQAAKKTISPATSDVFGGNTTFASSMSSPSTKIVNPFANLTQKDVKKGARMLEEAYQAKQQKSASSGRKGISPLSHRQTAKPFAQSPLARRVPSDDEHDEDEEEEEDTDYADEEGSGPEFDEEGEGEEYEEEGQSDFEDFEDPGSERGSEQDAESEEEAPEIIHQDEVERDMIHNQKVEPNPAPPKLDLPPSSVSVSDELELSEAFEKIYEVSNVMLNKVGAAARNLQAYVDAHKGGPNASISLKSEPSEWRLSDLPKFSAIIRDLQGRLATLEITESLEDDLQPLTQGIIAVQTKIDPMPQLIKPASENSSDRPLPPDHAILQKSLRTSLNSTSALMEKASRELALLQTALVSRDRGRKMGTAAPPTVEAVRNTIRKLTRLIVERKEDLDGIEAKLASLSMDGKASRYGGIEVPEFDKEFEESEVKETLAMRRAREAKVRKALEAKSVKFTRAAV